MRKVLLKAHLIAGLLGAAVLAIAGLTGTIMTMETEIDRWLNPSLWYVQPGGQVKTADELLDLVKDGVPGARAGGIRIPATPDLAYEFGLNDSRMAYIDPYTGRLLGTRSRADMITVTIHNLHTKLLAGETGETIVGISALLLVMLSISGLILWWPRKILAISSSAPWVRWNWEAHQVSGIISFIFLLTFSWTGSVIAFGEFLQPLVLAATRSEVVPDPPESTPMPGAKRIPLEQAIRTAQAATPGAKLTLCSIPGPPKMAIRVSVKYPEDKTPGGRTRVYLDQFSGNILRIDSPRTSSLGMKIIYTNRSLHTGDILGVPSRVLAGFCSLMVLVQAITGVLIWARRQKFWRAVVS